jgi:hypothetical protein
MSPPSNHERNGASQTEVDHTAGLRSASKPAGSVLPQSVMTVKVPPYTGALALVVVTLVTVVVDEAVVVVFEVQELNAGARDAISNKTKPDNKILLFNLFLLFPIDCH